MQTNGKQNGKGHTPVTLKPDAKPEPGVLDYVMSYMAETVEVDVPGIDKDGTQHTVTMPRAKAFARMVVDSSMNSGDPTIKRACINHVLNMTVGEGVVGPALPMNPASYHPKAIGFMVDLRANHGGQPAHAAILAALEAIPAE